MHSPIRALSKWSMLLGNLFEHYDTALFSLLSPFLAPLFFPHQDPLTALILTYCIIPLGMIARPLGSLLFGYVGDKRGRKQALVLSLSGMAIVTCLMGFLPIYSQVGIIAPILLSVCRIFQNFFASGESMGGAIYLIENTAEERKDLMSSFFNSSTIGGVLCASAAVSFLYAFDIVQEGWRYLYFTGGLTAIFIVFLRTTSSFNLDSAFRDTQAMQGLVSRNAESRFKHLRVDLSPQITFKSILSSCLERWHAVVAIAIASGFSYASYTLSLVMMNGFVPLVSSVSQAEMMHLNTFLLCIDFLILPFFGMLANRFSREKMMILSGIFATLIGFPLLWLLDGATLVTVILVRLIFVSIGVWFSAPFHAWSQSLVPATHRYSIVSFSYAIGSQIFGGPTAAFSLWLFQKTNWIYSVGLYWMILGLLASYCVAKQQAVAEDLSLERLPS